MKSIRLSMFVCLVVGVLVSACSQPRNSFRVIQAASEPYQIYLKGAAPDQPARLSAATGVNLRFIAAAGDVDFSAVVYAPINPDGSPGKIWEHRFHHNTGHQAWEFVISAEEDKEFIQVVPTTWASARASLVHLPADVGSDNLKESDVESSERFQLYRVP
ncbi:MAG: hypothetical protein Tsb0020_07500 [Haliangiales bacterium]